MAQPKANRCQVAVSDRPRYRSPTARSWELAGAVGVGVGTTGVDVGEADVAHPVSARAMSNAKARASIIGIVLLANIGVNPNLALAALDNRPSLGSALPYGR